jgi:nickel superoxide dismutase
MRMRSAIAALLVPAFLLASAAPMLSHCEIPCGIYGDDARFAAIGEDLQTIRKSMLKIDELSGVEGKGTLIEGSAAEINQIVRWINTKEEHADHIREIVTDYFLAQRVKTPDGTDAAAQSRYTGQLVLLHKMIVASMKCKQTTDLKNVELLHDLTHEFQILYEGK